MTHRRYADEGMKPREPQDDAEHEAAKHPIPCCGGRSTMTYVCCRAAYHEGDHVAVTRRGLVVARWPRAVP